MRATIEFVCRLLAERHLAVLAATIVVTCLCAWGVTRLRIEDDPYSAARSTSVAYRRLEQISREYAVDDEAIVVLLEAPDFFTTERIAALRKFVDRAADRPEVTATYSLLDARRPGPGRLQLPLVRDEPDDDDLARSRAAALAGPLINGQILSADGQTSLVLVRLSPTTQEDVAAIRRVSEALQRIADDAFSRTGVRVAFTGMPIIRLELVEATRRNVIVTTVLGAAVALAISIVLLRDVRAVITVTLPPALGSFWTIGMLGLSGVAVNVLTAAVSTLVLVIGLSDSIHLSQDIWRRRRGAASNDSAAFDALLHSGTACGITALTTALGFASLVLTDSPVVQQYGLILAGGSLTAFAVTIMTVPLLSGLFTTYHTADDESVVSRRISQTTNSIVDFSLARRRAICVVCGIVALLSLWIAPQLRPDTSFTENLPSRSTGRDALRRCDVAFGGVFQTLVVVHWPADQPLESPATAAAVGAVHELLSRHDVLSRPLSATSVVAALPNLGRNWSEIVAYLTARPRESMQRFFNVEQREAIVAAHTPDIGTAEMNGIVVDLRKRLARLEVEHPGYRFELTGTPVVATEIINQLLFDLGAGLGLEAVIIVILIALLFGSLRLGLVSLIPNLFPLACVAAVMSLVGMPLHFGSVLVFNVCLGLAVDDTVHFISRIADERREPTVEAMIRRGAAGVGTAVFAATLILCAGFGTLVVSDVYASRVFGGLSCVTLAASFVAELLLLPAVLATFARSVLESRRLPTTEAPRQNIYDFRN